MSLDCESVNGPYFEADGIHGLLSLVNKNSDIKRGEGESSLSVTMMLSIIYSQSCAAMV